MKTNILIFGLAALLAAGCASNSIAPMGNDTYMINRGGWPRMNGFAVQSECYRDANQFCTNRGLIMVPVSTTTIGGEMFAHNASCTLVFRAVASTNAPAGTYMIPQTVFVAVRQPFQQQMQQQNSFQQYLAAQRQQQQDNQNALQQTQAELDKTTSEMSEFLLRNKPVIPEHPSTAFPNISIPSFQLQPQPNLPSALQQQQLTLPPVWDMPKSSDVQTGKIKVGPDGMIWHEYRSQTGTYTYWKL